MGKGEGFLHLLKINYEKENQLWNFFGWSAVQGDKVVPVLLRPQDHTGLPASWAFQVKEGFAYLS